MKPEEYQHIFNLPFKEAETFFRGKLNIPTEKWNDIEKDMHAKGFIVAGAQKAELLTDFHDVVQKAIDGKMQLADFQSRFDEIVKQHGWSYNGSRNWRSELIYNTNVRTAYMAGRWQQLTEPGSKLPYLVYRHSDGVRHPRPLHVSWNGLTLPANHEFWQTHYPPNGWGCRCSVFAASEKDRQAAIAGGKGKPPAGYNAYTETDVLDKDGNVIRTKRTLPGIDEGWDYNVGQAMFKWQPDLDKFPFPIAKGLVGELTDNKIFQVWHDYTAKRVADELARPDFTATGKESVIKELRKRLATDETFPVAVLPEEVKKMIGAETQGVYLSAYDLIKQQVSRAGQNFEALEYIKAQTVIEDATLIVKEGDHITIFASDPDKKWYVAVLQTTETGKGVFLKSFRRSTLKDVTAQSRKGMALRNTI